jgi:hypothetical protein
MTESTNESEQHESSERKEPLSPDELVHAYGGFLIVAVPLILIVLLLWYLLS